MFGARARILSLVASAALIFTMFAAAPPAQAKSVKAATPHISGTVTVGSTLTAKRGTWKPSGVKLYYRWLRNGSAISGATHSTYKLAVADLGKKISVKLTGKKKHYKTVSKTSAAVGPVGGGVLTAPTPTISGTAKVGASLTANPGTWTAGTGLAYQWKANGSAIGGATGKTFVVSLAQAGAAVTVTVTGTKAYYKTVSKTSAPFGPIGGGTLTASTPTISGTAKVGASLTANPGTWTAGTSLAYQWKANGNAIGGASGKTFVAGFAQEGAAVTVTVTGTKASYATKSATSAAVTIAAPSGLRNGEILPLNKQLRSPNGQYALYMQGDGNLVEAGPSGVVWATGTAGADHLVLQGDGNLVLYTGGGAAKWGSGTDGYGAGVTLAMQDDGNLVLYRDGSAVWTRAVVRWIFVGAKAMAGSTPGTQSMSGPTLNSTQYGVYAPNQKVPVVCGTTSGQGVKGAYSSTLDPTWHRTLRGDWVPDADFLTGTNGLFAGEPDCTPAGGGVGANKVDNYVAAHPEGTTVGDGECVALVKDYLHAVYGLNPGALGNAEKYRPGLVGGNYFAANGFVWHTDQNFQEGDVLVWSQTKGLNGSINTVGHVGIWYKGAKPLFQSNAWPLLHKISFGVFFNGGVDVYSGYWRHA